MTNLLYVVYAVTVLFVAVGGMLAVVFATPDVEGRSGRGAQALAVLASLFLVALVLVEFVL